MHSNSSDFNQILNIAPSRHMQNIQNVTKDTSTSQEHPQSSSTPAKTLETSSIFESVLDAFKLNRFQPNFKHGFLRAYADHPKHHKGNQPQSGTSTMLPKVGPPSWWSVQPPKFGRDQQRVCDPRRGKEGLSNDWSKVSEQSWLEPKLPSSKRDHYTPIIVACIPVKNIG